MKRTADGDLQGPSNKKQKLDMDGAPSEEIVLGEPTNLENQDKKVEIRKLPLNLDKLDELWNSGKIFGCFFEGLEMQKLTLRDIGDLEFQPEKLSPQKKEDGFLLFIIGTCLFRLGEIESPQEYFDAGLKKLQNSEKTATNLMSLACICQHKEQFDSAQQYFEEARQIASVAVTHAQFGRYSAGQEPVLSIHHLQKAADAGNSHAQFELGQLYGGDLKIIEPQDGLQSKYFDLAAKQGHVLAIYTLGCQYYKQKEYEIAFRYFNEAVKGGDVESHTYLGQMCFYGQGVVEDKTRALNHLLVAVTTNPKPVVYHLLGESYFSLKDYENALKFFFEAVSRDHQEAYYFLGHCFHEGLGVKVDMEIAKGYYKSTSDERAVYALAQLYTSSPVKDETLAPYYHQVMKSQANQL